MSKKTIKISDLSAQKAEMERMATQLEGAMNLIVTSINSMTNAGIESFSPVVTSKMKELLNTMRVQVDDLRTGVAILQNCMDTMTNVDVNVRKRIQDGNISGVYPPIGFPPSDQVVEGWGLVDSQWYRPSGKGESNVWVPGYKGLQLRDENGNLNLQAFNQNLGTYQQYPDYTPEQGATAMAAAGCNLCSNAFVLSDMGYNLDPLSYYHNVGGLCDPIASGNLIGGIRTSPETSLEVLQQYMQDNVNNPSQYSKPVLCCATNNPPEYTHFVALVDCGKDEFGNFSLNDCMVMDPADGRIKKLSEVNLGVAPNIKSFVRYAK